MRVVRDHDAPKPEAANRSRGEAPGSTPGRGALVGHLARVLPPLALAGFYLLAIDRFDGYQLTSDACMIFERVQNFVIGHHWPLAGNPVYQSWRLGPLSDFLTAAPLFLTRRIIDSYHFLWLLFLASIPLFYTTIWRRFHHGAAAFLAACWFALPFMFPANLMVTPWNTSYLPLFLALYSWLLYAQPRGPNCHLFSIC